MRRDEPARPSRECDIEFVGGPLDGHRDLCSTSPERLPLDVVCFVGANAFRQLDGRAPLPHDPVTSVALYECETRNTPCRYRFIGAISVKDVALEG